MGGGTGIGVIRMALARVQPALSDDDKKAVEEILTDPANVAKAKELQTATAWTEEQRGGIRDAMTKMRGETPPLRMGSKEGQAFLNKELKATDAQVKGQKDMAAFVAELVKKIKAKLTPEQGTSLQTAVDNPMAGRGGRRGKAKTE